MAEPEQTQAGDSPTDQKPTVSVIVPVHGGGEAFGLCLASLSRLDPPADEIIIVADGDDRSAEQAERFCFTVIRQDRRTGPAAARNSGARHARSDILLFLDADVTVPPDTVATVLAAMTGGTDAICGSYDDAPAAGNFLSQYKNLFHHYVHQTARGQGSTFWAACGAIRREAFLAVGGFDEAYTRPCVEDIELGYRLRLAGRTIRFCKALQVKHYKKWTVGSLLKSDFFDRALPWTELILSRRQLVNDLNLRTAARVSVVLTHAMLLCLVAAVWRPILLALAAALLVINIRLYGFFYRRRGLWFALGCIPWHWLYYLYSGLGFAAGLAMHLFGRWRPRRAEQPGDLRISQGRMSRAPQSRSIAIGGGPHGKTLICGAQCSHHWCRTGRPGGRRGAHPERRAARGAGEGRRGRRPGPH